MGIGGILCGVLLLASVAAAQTPVVKQVVNSASGIQAGLPNSGLAQGGIILIVGQNLGPATLGIDQSPFTQTSLQGTSARVTVKGQAADLLMYYTSATQVAGLLPSNTPVGAGTITVTYNGATSAAVLITVVQNNLGIFTTTSNGTGAAIVTYPDYSLVSQAKAANCGGPNTLCGAANPGDTLILWGTGLGPVSAADSSGPQPGNMANIPLKLWLGGVQATVSYQGRSGCCIGEDQIVFVVPDGVPTGCAVPLAVQINDQISNYTVMPVSSSGRNCSLAQPGFDVNSDAIQQLIRGAPVTYTQVKLNRRLAQNGQGYEDRGDAQFLKISAPAAVQPFILSLIDTQPLGTCIVANALAGSDPPLTFLGAPDAGASLSVSGPVGNRALPKQSTPGPTDYFAVLGPGNYLNSGSFSITGPGGPDVGAFTATISLPSMPVLVIPQGLSPVVRSKGVTVNWIGGAPNSIVEIDGESATDGTFTNGAIFACFAPASAGTFTIPPSVLYALPAGSNAALIFNSVVNGPSFTAKGLDAGFVSSSREEVVVVSVQ
jgi:uncharacterized protein (TIGR03437 family)